MKEKKRIVWIDILRSLCMIWIISRWHMDSYANYEIQFTDFEYQLTYCILATFTTISGFFAYSNTINNWKDIFKYYKKKLLRIYPLFVLACFCLYLTGYNNIGVTIKTILGIGEFYPEFPLTVWYVAILLVFYFLTPYLIAIKDKKKRFCLFLFFEIVFFILSHLIGTDSRLYYYWIFYYLGMIIRNNDYHLKLNKSTNFCVTILSYFIFVLIGNFIGSALNKYTIICAVAFIYFISSILKYLFEKVEKNKIFEMISYASFCAYLFHRFIYSCLVKLSGNFNIVQTFVNIILVILLSWLIQYGYDKLINILTHKKDA